jgi:hypothetical protein
LPQATLLLMQVPLLLLLQAFDADAVQGSKPQSKQKATAPA